VIFAFNRPVKLQRILKALEMQEVESLVVFVDGPRGDQDLETVERCRALARSVDWAELDLRFSEKNKGLASIADKISDVFDTYESAIFLEDDTLPMPSFYSFMRQGLDYYEKVEKVFSLGGYQPVSWESLRGYSYSLVSCPRFLCWGWATWRERWLKIEPYLSNYYQLFDGLSQVPNIAGRDLANMARACAEDELDSWAVKVAIATLWLSKVHLLPVRGLVRNIGHDASGSHTTTREQRQAQKKAARLHNRNIYTESFLDIKWLDDVSLTNFYIEELIQFVQEIGVNQGTRTYLRKMSLLRKGWRLARRAKNRLLEKWQSSSPERLYDLNLYNNGTESEKRALVSYLVHPFSVSRDDPRFLRHINIWRSYEIVRVLNRLGYTIDVVDYRDTEFVPSREYDLFIGHGGINFEFLAESLAESTIKIYFATGDYWKFWNEQELIRFSDLYDRKGVELTPDRFIRNSEEKALAIADAVIGIGNEFTAETYADFSPVVMMNNTFLTCECRGLDKDFESGRDHFLFFAGDGNVHKGLDLLLEAFVGLEQHLWICSRIDREFAEVYSKELHEHPNIHLLKWIQARSDEFYDLMARCNYVVLPSCAEGQPHSVVECMGFGLIPVVSRACGLDVEDYGILLEPCTIGEIADVVARLSSYPATWHQERSRRVQKIVQEDFSEQAFSKNLQSAVQKVIRKEGF
jgi:hypothetical protein